MDIIIQNANVLIDLVKTELVDLPFLLDANFTIPELVFEGLHREQKSKFEAFIKKGLLCFGNLTSEEYLLICNLVEQNRRLSAEDFTGLLLAQQKRGLLLTDCKHSVSIANQFAVTPVGILWVLDKLIEINKITTSQGYIFLSKLMEANKRMMKDDCAKRLAAWN